MERQILTAPVERVTVGTGVRYMSNSLTFLSLIFKLLGSKPKHLKLKKNDNIAQHRKTGKYDGCKMLLGYYSISPNLAYARNRNELANQIKVYRKGMHCMLYTLTVSPHGRLAHTRLDCDCHVQTLTGLCCVGG